MRIWQWCSITTLLLGLPLTSICQASKLAQEYQSQIGNRLQKAINESQPGVAGLLFGKKVQELSRQQILQMAQKQSPKILANQQRRTIAEAGVVQQAAGFDWTFGVSTSLTQTNFNARSEEITRERVTTLTNDGSSIADGLENPDGTGEEGVPLALSDNVGNLLCITVAGEIVNEEQCTLQTEITTEEEFASGDADSTNAWTLSTTSNKILQTGSRMQVGVGVSRRTKNFYPLDDLGLIGAISNSDPIGEGSRFPWTSKIFAEFQTPLPFGKNYGRYGSPVSLGRELSRINNDQSRHSENALLQILLLQIDNGYWNHVRSVLNLHSAGSRLANIQARLDSAERRYNSQDLTSYELTQVQSAMASSRAQEQSAWLAFIETSNQLVQLLDMDHSSLILPAGFYEDLKEHEPLNRISFHQHVLKNNPGLNASRASIRGNEVLLKNAGENLKPDLNVVINLELSQSDRVLGYEDLGGSLGNLFDPDNTNWFLGVQYKLPFGRNADKARRSQAAVRLTQSRQSLTLEELNLTARVNALIVRNDTTLSLLNHAEKRFELAQTAYDKALSARNRGRLTEFEFLTILDNLDGARRAWINQLIAQQQIKSDSLVLEGKLSTLAGGGQ